MRINQQAKIAYLISQYPAVNHTFILREVRRLRELGLDIHVISIRGADRPPEKLMPDELDEARLTYYVKPLGPAGALRPHLETLVSRPLGYLRGLAAALRGGGGDLRRARAGLFYFAEAVIVGRWMERRGLSHAHTHFSSTVALIARRIFPISISATVHGPEELNDLVGSRWAEKIGASSFVCAISHYARSQLMRVCDHRVWGKIEVCPLGVDPTAYAPRPRRGINSPFEVICVGRLVPAKGQHVLIAALDRLVREGREVRLRLVGDGPDRPGLERSVAERGLSGHVVFEGRLNHDRVQELYRGADLFALASFAEGVPVVLMEAMAMEIPCVATAITGIPELIRNGVDGLLVTPSDEAALSRAIGRLMDDPELCRRLGEAGRRRVMKRYHLGRNTAYLADVFRRRVPGAAGAADRGRVRSGLGARLAPARFAGDESGAGANPAPTCRAVDAVGNGSGAGD